jgi:hypothetical protein
MYLPGPVACSLTFGNLIEQPLFITPSCTVFLYSARPRYSIESRASYELIFAKWNDFPASAMVCEENLEKFHAFSEV